MAFGEIEQRLMHALSHHYSSKHIKLFRPTGAGRLDRPSRWQLSRMLQGPPAKTLPTPDDCAAEGVGDVNFH